MTIIIFLLILTVLVFVHELGHFLAAKKSGIRVDEFAIGFPPKLFSWKRGETKYSINLIPFGGFVKIFGENPDDESMQGPDKDRSFINKKRHIQAFVLVAGILMNFIFAFIAFTGSFLLGTAEVNDQNDGSLFITSVIPDSPAYISGLKEGDRVVKLERGDKVVSSPNPDSLRDFVSVSGDELNVTISRNGKEENLSITPKEGNEDGKYLIGISMANISFNKYSIFESITKGFTTTISVTKDTFFGIINFLYSVITFGADLQSVSGPVGIVNMVGQAKTFGLGFLLSFTGIISVNLAIINLIPFPALDGGRLLFVAIEAIRRKAINPKIQNTFNFIGFALLMILMLVVTYSDIRKLF